MAEHVDAILIPRGWAPPAHVRGQTRQEQIFVFAEGLLGPGKKAWICDIGSGDQKFIRPDPESTLLFPDGHRLARTPRYDWVPMPDGSQLGYLKPEAKADLDLANETPSQRAEREAAAQAQADAYSQRAKDARRWAELRSKGDGRTAEESAEFGALSTMFQNVGPAAL